MKKLKIALFVGMDLIAQLMASALVLRLKEAGHSVLLIYPDGYVPSRSRHPELLEKDFFQGLILHKYIHPYLDDQGLLEGANYFTIRQLVEKFQVQKIHLGKKDLNRKDSPLLRWIAEEGVDGGISFRYPFIFKPTVINAFQSQPSGFFWNMHSASLPNYRGLSPLTWMLYDRQETASFTLHQIDTGIDTGEIIGLNPQEIDHAQTVFTNLFQLYPSAIQTVVSAIREIALGARIETSPNRHDEARYFSKLTETDFQILKERNIRLIDKTEMRDFYLNLCSKEGTAHHQGLMEVIDQAYKYWDKRLTSYS